MTTARELAEVVAGALEGATSTVAARWEGPADNMATPAVVVSPADPWLNLPRLGACPTERWTVALVLGRWDAPASLQLAQAGYLAAAPLVYALPDAISVGALDAPYPETVAGVPVLVARFAVALNAHP